MSGEALAVYVHVPFCTVKCGYCDFNAYSGLDALVPAYEAALVAEVAGWAPVLGNRTVSSISFGGGTPGEFPASGIAAVIDAVRALANVSPGAEISLEANPGTVTLPYLLGLAAAGVTRLSLGAQSFHADELRFLDRIHSPEATAAALGLAREAGFASVSLDLIYGLPGQQPSAWAASLERAVELAPDHVSCYALTVEEGTPLAHRVASGTVVPLDPDTVADMYEFAQDRLAAAGYAHYELSNWARPGHESRHNLAYWTDREYLAFGAGAHGYLRGQGAANVRYENIAHPRFYIESLRGGGPMPGHGLPSAAVAQAYEPPPAIARFDWLETALRLTAGFDPARYAARFGESLGEAVGPVLAECAEAGVVECSAGNVRLTRRGLLLHSEVCARLLAHLQRAD